MSPPNTKNFSGGNDDRRRKRPNSNLRLWQSTDSRINSLSMCHMQHMVEDWSLT